LVEELVRAKINDGQLDGCPLTLRELALVKESFSKTLRSMLHSRIDYQKPDDKSTAKRPSDLSRDPHAHSERLSTVGERSE
jgi:membrane-associated HD superfamily phosphohydrolase